MVIVTRKVFISHSLNLVNILALDINTMSSINVVYFEMFSNITIEMQLMLKIHCF